MATQSTDQAPNLALEKDQPRDWKTIVIVVLVCFVIWSQVKVTRPEPNPGPNPGPNPAPKVDKELVDGSTAALRALVAGMAEDMSVAKAAIRDKKAKTVTELATITQANDEATRKVFKESMGKLLAPRLGTGEIKENTEAIFNDVESGFRKVLK